MDASDFAEDALATVEDASVIAEDALGTVATSLTVAHALVIVESVKETVECATATGSMDAEAIATYDARETAENAMGIASETLNDVREIEEQENVREIVNEEIEHVKVTSQV